MNPHDAQYSSIGWRAARKPSLTLIACVLAISAGCGGEREVKQMPRLGTGVLLIEVDAWRRDHLSLYGYAKPTTPFLESLASESIVFEDAWSSGSHRLPATAALLSGCDSILCRHPGFEWEDGSLVPAVFPWRFPEAMPLLAFQFLAAGWDTARFDGSADLTRLGGAQVGFGALEGCAAESAKDLDCMPFADLEARYFDWLGALDPGADWFAYWNLADLEQFAVEPAIHADFRTEKGPDYLPPMGGSEPEFHTLPPSRYNPALSSLGDYIAAYDTRIAMLDKQLAGLFAELRSRGLLGRTTVVLVGGYGMGFGESGLFAQSGSVSEAELAIPLLIRPARDLDLAVGKRVPGLVSLVDVAPTVLDLARVGIPAGWQGHSLRPLWTDGGPIRAHAFAIPFLHEGFAALDGDGLFLRMWPQWSRFPRLGQSWYGEDSSDQEPVEVLLARREGLRPLAYRLGLSDQKWADELRQRGLIWHAWGTQIARTHHSEPLGSKPTPAVLEGGESDPLEWPTWAK